MRGRHSCGFTRFTCSAIFPLLSTPAAIVMPLCLAGKFQKKKTALSHGLTADRFSPPVIRSEGRPSGRLASQLGGSSNHFCVSGTLVWKRHFSHWFWPVFIVMPFAQTAMSSTCSPVLHVLRRVGRTILQVIRGSISAQFVRYKTDTKSVYRRFEIVRKTQR